MTITNEILERVRKAVSAQPRLPLEIFQRARIDPRIAQEALTLLIDRGVVTVTDDLRVRTATARESRQRAG